MNVSSEQSRRGGDSRANSVARHPAWLGGALLLSIIAGAAWLHEADADRYYRLVQEDEAIEWATVWFLLVAAVGFSLVGSRARGLARLAPILLALFCVGVAGEEISWGQRLLGFQPPAVFLEHNDQQELNLHNTLPKGLRKLALPAFLMAYGVGLPLIMWVPGLRRRLDELGLEAPDLGLALGFATAGGLYLVYPWRFTGEWIELMLGTGLALHAVRILGGHASRSMPSLAQASAVLLVGLLAIASSAWAREGRRIDPQLVATARLELEALREDFRRGRIPSQCGDHKRLYRHLGEAGDTPSFRSLVRRGLPEERAAFFLDPWNSPYWIRDQCGDDGSRRVSIYSLGGNRLRESTQAERGGDDVEVQVASTVGSGR